MDESENTIINPAEEKICCICGRSDETAHEFEFHYGKSRGIAKTSKVDPTAYNVKGAFKGFICHRCFYLNHMPALLVGLFVALAILFGSWYYTIASHQQEYPFYLTLVVVVIGFGTYQTFSIMKKYHNSKIDGFVIDDGAKLLIKNKKQGYIQQGYDSFWTPDEYNQMQEKLRPKPSPEPKP
jgi:hypothetical protein